jgi:photosystem I subunit 2
MAALAATSAATVALSATQASSNAAVSRSVSLRLSGLQGQKLAAVCNGARVMMADAAKGAPDVTAEAPKGFTPPTLNADTPAPIFGGSTGGLLRKAQVEEFYVITWESPKEQIFEMPTGGAAIMRSGPNLLKLARKEQCLALGARLRTKFKIQYQFYRVFPNGEVQYLHPKDGVYPEKVNAGRSAVGVNNRSIGKNANPAELKFTGKPAFDL